MPVASPVPGGSIFGAAMPLIFGDLFVAGRSALPREFAVQPPGHLHRERAFARQDIGGTLARAEQTAEVRLVCCPVSMR